ncbi:MAG: hypothetical protein ACREAE_04490 [Nitrosopumilaceae archaeon]
MKSFDIIASVNDNAIKEKLKEPYPTLSVIGRFYIRFGEKALPNSEWDDFVFIVVTWWLKDLLTLLKKGRVRCDFMDDNYKMDLTIYPNTSALRFSFFHEGLDIYYVKDEQIQLDEYVKALFRVASMLDKQITRIDSQVSTTCNDYVDFKENKKKAEKAWRDYVS